MMNRHYQTVWFAIILLSCNSCLTHKAPIQYTQKSTISHIEGVKSDTVAYGDTLFLVKDSDNTPLYFYQDIQTGVCFDDRCRRLHIVVLWNITGRYQGFKLPEGEFLSKTDHVPFSKVEYERLHALLANPELPFSSISYDELMEDSDPNNPEIDGISGATSKAVSEIVVQGAAYTTYKLWSIVYGPTRDEIVRLTEQQLTPAIYEKLLNSPVQTDKVWALERMEEIPDLTTRLGELVATSLTSQDFSLAYSAITAIKSNHLVNEQLQIQLFTRYDKALPSIRSLMVKKLMDAPRLSDEVIKISCKFLDQVNGKELGDLLKLYTAHKVKNDKVLTRITKLLNHENAFISNQVQRYLKESEAW